MVINSSSKHYNSLESENMERVVETTEYQRVQSAPNICLEQRKYQALKTAVMEYGVEVQSMIHEYDIYASHAL